MVKNRRQDLDELEARSKRLASSIGSTPFTHRPGNFRVNELFEAARQFNGGRGVSSSAAGVAPDAKRVVDEVNNISLKGSEEKGPGLEGISLDNYLAHHHDMIFLTAVQASQSMSQQAMEESQRRWLYSEWESSHEEYIESLGHRMLPSTIPSNTLLLPAPPSSRYANASMITPLQRKHADIVRMLARSSQSVESSPNLPRPCIDLIDSLSLYHPDEDQSLLSKADLLGYKTILQIISHMVGETNSSTDNLRSMDDSLANKLKATNKPAYFATICYEKERLSSVTTAQELHHMLTRGALSYYSELAMESYSRPDGHGNLGSRMPGSTRRHIIDQYVEENSRMNTITIYTKLYHYLRAGAYRIAIDAVEEYIARDKDIHFHKLSSHLLVVLRALAFGGELLAATPGGPAAELKFTTPAKRNPPPSTSVSMPADITPRRLEEAIAMLRKGYEEEKEAMKPKPASTPSAILSSVTSAPSLDIFKLLVLNLLGIIDKEWYTTGYDMDGYTLEDFLWAHLFVIHLREIFQLVESQSVASGVASTSGGKLSITSGPFSPYAKSAKKFAQSQPTRPDYLGEHEELLELIQSYGGAEYFDADHRVYKYVMILLACHRFGDAINYLHRHDKPFVAAHVASIALYYGLVLPHLPLQCNPSLPIVVANGMSDLNPSQVLDSYLRKYLRAHLQVVHPNQSTKEEEQALVRIMVDYLILLHSRFWMTSTSLRIVSHDSSLSLKEVYQHNALMHFSHTLQDFIVNLPHPSFVEAIVGRLQENTPGVRSRGALDDYLSTAEVQQLLVKVSMAFKTAFHDYPMALHYCLLSGEYGLLLEELVDLLMTVYSSFYHSLVYPNSSTSSGTAEWMSHDHGNQEGGPHSGCLLPNISQHSRDQFLQWFEYLQEFLQKYLRNDVPSSLLAKINALENGPRYVNALLFLHNLYLATKVYLVDGWIVEASRLFDQLPVLSMGGGDQAMSASLLGILHQSLVSQIGDEVLCLYAQCQYTLFQYYKQRSLAGPSVTGAGSAGEVLRQQEGCAVARDRLRAVYHYVHQNKQLLRSRERTVAEVQRLCAVAL